MSDPLYNIGDWIKRCDGYGGESCIISIGNNCSGKVLYHTQYRAGRYSMLEDNVYCCKRKNGVVSKVQICRNCSNLRVESSDDPFVPSTVDHICIKYKEYIYGGLDTTPKWCEYTGDNENDE